MINLPKIVSKSKKRVGRGMGSGKGSHTVGRGQKGQKSMKDLHILFEGMKTKKSFLKRLPLLRGKGKFKSRVTRSQKMAAFKDKKSSSKSS
jgi:large subunit ribosomal protein L15